jgi:hypothetical protein
LRDARRRPLPARPQRADLNALFAATTAAAPLAHREVLRSVVAEVCETLHMPR